MKQEATEVQLRGSSPESGQIDELPDWAQSYFDYEAYGRDLEIEGQFYKAAGSIYVEING